MKIDGKKFSEMCISAANALNNDQAAINALNVFPVPDGDTGVNMSLTMSTIQNLNNFEGTVAECATRVADCMLRAARGNSGAILSLFFRGFAKSLRGLQEVDVADIANAFEVGTREAYSAVMTPTEGTILTVMRVCAEHAVAATRKGQFTGDLPAFFGYILKVANDVLAKTPELLPLLKEAGVVDAGGSGFVTVISGMLASLQNHPIARENIAESEGETSAVAEFADFETGDIKFAYCTECIVDKDEAHQGEGKCSAFREFLVGIGDSLVFIEDESIVKVHVHTNNPGQVLEKAVALGMLSMVKVENMRNQHTGLVNKEEAEKAAPRAATGFISIAVGEGVANVFRDLGVNFVVPGGQTMNPSTDDILAAIDQVNADTIFIMPNNKNIFMVADRAAEMTEDKRIIVLPTTQFTQGIAAMMVYDESADADTNTEAMKAAIESVTTLSFTHAVRDADIDGMSIKDGQVLGLVNGKVKAVENTTVDTLRAIVAEIGSPSFLTVYVGTDATEEETAAFEALLTECAPDAELAMIEGGQPLYPYVIAAE
ncbi:MAG: DAK2 domain-containing protein [Clostridia bacterium]|nr:DAK2 domain-containing protein [Clostridia bacterium]